MKRRWALGCALLLLMALLPLSGLADFSRGERGEEVREMQSMLIEMGFLDDKADGILGKKTEAGVKRLQAYLGQKESGVLDDIQLLQLYDLYFAASGVREGDGPGEEELKEMYPSACSWAGEDEWGAVFCYRHLEEKWVAEKLSGKNPPKQLEMMLQRRLCELWERDILAMYDEWEENAPEQEAEIAGEQRKIFESALSENRQEWHWKGAKAALREESVWLEMQGIDLCFDFHGMESNE